MSPVLPMFIPENIGIEARNDQAGHSHAIKISNQYTAASPRVILK